MLRQFKAIIKSYRFKFFCYSISAAILVAIIAVFSFYQFYLKPNIPVIKEDIESFIAKETGGEVFIEKLNVAWDFTSPRFQIRNFSISDTNKNKIINLNAIDIQISWVSIFKLEPVLNEIIVGDINVLVERTIDQKFKIAGMEIFTSSRSKISDWLLNQKDIKIINGEITWRDHYRNAEDLNFKNINFHYNSPTYLSYLDRHKFKLSAKISSGTKNKIHMYGFFDLDSLERFDNLNSEITVEIPQAYIPAFQPWIDYPFKVKQGYGDLKLKIAYVKNQIEKIKTTFNIENFIGNFNLDQNQFIKINLLSGNAIYENKNEVTKIAATGLVLETKQLNLKDSGFEVITNKDNLDSFKLKLNELNIDAAEILLNQATFFETLKTNLTEFNPSGIIKNLKMSWIREKPLFFSGSLNNFGISNYKNFPKISNLTSTINIEDGSGSMNIDSNNIMLDHENLLENELFLKKLSGDVSWEDNKIKFSDLMAQDDAASMKLIGTVNITDTDNPELDLDFIYNSKNISNISNYLPKKIDPQLSSWIKTSLIKGNANNLSGHINGKLNDFPFDGSDGNFFVVGQVDNAQIEFASGYPELKNTSFNVDVKNNLIKFTTEKGEFANLGIELLEIQNDINDNSGLIDTYTKLRGPSNNLINSINNSPLYNETKGFTNQLVAEGDGLMTAKISYFSYADLPVKFEANYKVENLKIENPSNGIPEIKKINAVIELDNESIIVKQGTGEIFDMPIIFDVNKKNTYSKIVAKGELTEDFFIKNLSPAWSSKVNGSAQWDLELNINEDSDNLSITSDMLGIEIDGPEPLKKRSDEVKLLSIIKKPSKDKFTNYVLRLEDLINGKIEIDPENKLTGQINILSNEEFKKRNGLSIFANLTNINFNEYSNLFKSDEDNENSFRFSNSVINFETLVVNGFTFNRLETKILPSNTGLKLALYSNEIKGNMLWDYDQDKLTGRFNKIIIDKDKQLGMVSNQDSINTIDTNFNLDFRFDEVFIDDKKYGSLELLASINSDKNWNIDLFKLSDTFHELSVDGQWIISENISKTQTNFKWDISDLEKTMAHLDYPSLVKNGSAKLNGIANWDGSPFEFSSDQLNGNFSLDLKKGEILEAKPGIGRLFGLLTLQNLPKRLSLDFSDLFSKGFIFDSISAGVRMNQGILMSNNFKMIGPAAEVNMDGEVDMLQETQNLHIVVKPFVSDSLSLAALAGGPLAGAAAFIAQKVLKDPLNKVLTDEYALTGTWDEPIESPVSQKNSNVEQENEEVIEPSSNILNRLNIFKDDNE
jgi:uncharacterized protein (TIGR02099 family)